MKKSPGLLVAAVLVISSCSWADGLGTLIEASKGLGAAKAALKAETANFDRAKAALDGGFLEKGQTKEAILRQCGEPVVANEDFPSKRERWVYKPASSSFFKGPRLYLFFDAAGALDEVKMVT